MPFSNCELYCTPSTLLYAIATLAYNPGSKASVYTRLPGEQNINHGTATVKKP
jgi:hypothetical protein